MRTSIHQPVRDDGNVLPLVLVVSVVLSMVVVAIASYTTTTLRYGQVVEQSADRLAAADGALDHELEEFRQKRTECLTKARAGLTQTFPDTMNGVRPEIYCKAVAGDISSVDAWAIVITGLTAPPADPLLYISGGGASGNAVKTFTGPVYIADPSRMTFASELNIDRGDLWYTDPGCLGDDGFDVTNLPLPSRLTLTPEGRTTICARDSYDVLFADRRPPEPTDFSSYANRSSVAPTPDATGCYVWEPGRYTVPPDFANQSYNYFKSGNYYFDNTAQIDLKSSYVLAGYPGAAGPSVFGRGSEETAENNPCRFAWYNDPDRDGATFYMGGSSRFYISANASLEVVGRRQGTSKVSLQAFSSSDISAGHTSTNRRYILSTQPGNGKQLAMRGLVWAPRASFEFGNITNSTVAALTGGAYVATLNAGASANANNFLIEVDTRDSDTTFIVTSSATLGGATTTVRALIKYRGTDGALAVLSRRVLRVTPE